MNSLKQAKTDIDFIITWVDGNDPAWQAEKAKYSTSCIQSDLKDVDRRDIRYRPWNTLRYVFRGIDRYAPWVRRVHFVTCGHLPSWLNIKNPKLHLVKHADYIPAKYLPTFNSSAIEFNFHRIEDLSEHFVNFNDDTVIIGPTKPSDFFWHGQPCETAVLSPSRVINGDWFYAPVTNDAIINKYFSAHKTVWRHPLKWLNPKYGTDVLRTITMLPYRCFFGFEEYHLPDSLLKTTLQKVWEEEPDLMNNVCSHRFRVPTDANQWLFQCWQLAEDNFHPRSSKLGQAFQLMSKPDAVDAARYIEKQKGAIVCVNDNLQDAAEFKQIESIITNSLNSVLPEKSSFEI